MPPTKPKIVRQKIQPKKMKPLGQDVKSLLSEKAKERRVPGSRLGRMVSFGGLAAGLGVGAVAEVARRSLGFTDPKGTVLSRAYLGYLNSQLISISVVLCMLKSTTSKIKGHKSVIRLICWFSLVFVKSLGRVLF